ncbi:MAG: GTPase Era [Candidatus Solibacter usitatus]|nr:GTPase Era [Candidatus Solibacter usitatus]
MTEPGPNHVSGFVSIVGRTNAGKSTLMNAMLGTKLSIVANKPQTTRTTIQGVSTTADAQVVFLDTPGIHEGKTLLHERMLSRIREALEGRDLILFLADAAQAFSEKDEQALQWVKALTVPSLLVLNKIDLLHSKNALLPLLARYREAREFQEYIPISARTGEGLDSLRAAILARLPKGPRYFPEDYLTDQPERFLASELIREKILHYTREEVPHSVAVFVERWVEEKSKKGEALTRVLATIHVERDGQKAILIGERGAMMKRIGTDARTEMEQLFARKFYLELFVKVTPDWRQRGQFLAEMDQSAFGQRE